MATVSTRSTSCWRRGASPRRGVRISRRRRSFARSRPIRPARSPCASTRSTSWARLFEQQGRIDDAKKMYATALATFESARAKIKNEDSKLPYFANATPIYDDYIRLLISQGKEEAALAAADQSPRPHPRAGAWGDGREQIHPGGLSASRSDRVPSRRDAALLLAGRKQVLALGHHAEEDHRLPPARQSRDHGASSNATARRCWDRKIRSPPPTQTASRSIASSSHRQRARCHPMRRWSSSATAFSANSTSKPF